MRHRAGRFTRPERFDGVIDDGENCDQGESQDAGKGGQALEGRQGQTD